MQYILFQLANVRACIYMHNMITHSLVLIILALKCYQCKEPDPRCRDTFQNDTAFFKPCPANATKCRKYKWEGN